MVDMTGAPKHWSLIAAVLALLLGISPWAMAANVQTTGYGVDQDQAVASALRAAVEAGVGVSVNSRTLVENFEVIKDEIVSHAQGYVTSYKIISSQKDASGGVAVTIDAEVDAGLIKDHAQVLDILMKMAGHPRVLIFGVDEDLNSAPVATEQFAPLLKAVTDVFRDQFRFEVVDWRTIAAKRSGLPGVPTREAVAKNNSLVKADYYVTVSLDLGREAPKRELALTLTGVRTSDNYQVGKVVRPAGSIEPGKAKPKKLNAMAVDKAMESVFPAAVDLAKAMVEDIQSEVEAGNGFRYTLGFYDFPDQEAILQELAGLHGYVRHQVDKMDKRNLAISYWSNLRSDELDREIEGFLRKRQYQYQHKQDGRVLKYKWEHPDGF
ncbi:MAG: hypothetical protein AB7D07_11955 [Desulfovibrionaceae bacterium]